MKVSINIQAGICGFETTVTACGSGVKEPTLIEIESNCEKIIALGESVREVRGLDEITRGFDGVIMSEARNVLRGCCAGCVVPAGIFKATQVASELALPKDILISMTKEEE
ncbi:DUF6951 family protein [Phosphitispora fastidiosa]|uniref:DUF6951 family protein n=1 Tax=Phosphitispora fastidiosa TaxID=2837202 RepID=UPI001E36FDD7|nr:hypothetical protein [Phosphitispora fastidiosa]MBU7008066.1 hypothetical protein [Phosphitispora fastidiosa]